jgi:AraC-like DNA-binding protein
MVTYQHIPSAPLSRFVQSLWLCDEAGPAGGREKVLPNGSLQLLISLRDEPLSTFDAHGRPRSLSGIAVSGAQSRHVLIDSGQLGSIMSVAFRPGMAWPFLDLPPGDLQDAYAPLDAIWGRAALDLREQLMEAGTATARFQLVEGALLGRAGSRLECHPAVTYALSQFAPRAGARPVRAVTEEVGLSAKRFIDVFRREVGLPPKLFGRIRRFQHVLGLVREGRPVNWAQVALACGYFDQAHLNRDFRAFSSLSPSSYLHERGDFQNHVPLR